MPDGEDSTGGSRDTHRESSRDGETAGHHSSVSEGDSSAGDRHPEHRPSNQREQRRPGDHRQPDEPKAPSDQREVPCQRGPNHQQEWDALVLEYEHLRSEIEQAISNQVKVLGYGGATLSLLIGLGVGTQRAVILVVAPFLAAFFFMLWSIEQTRMMRAGEYIERLEQYATDEVLDPGGLGWERWLSRLAERDGTDLNSLHYVSQYSVLGGFLLVVVLSTVMLWIGPAVTQEWPAVFTGSVRLLLSGVYLLMACVGVVVLYKTVSHETRRAGLDRDARGRISRWE